MKDGWDNFDEVARTVYIYESEQYGGTAFYATPINKVTANISEFPGFYSDANSSVVRDLDGDGVSDFWENALGTNAENASDFPDMNNTDIFKNLNWANYTIPRDN